MSYNLSRLDDGEPFVLSNGAYLEILDLARKNGWEPDGTSKIDDEGEEDSDWNELDYESHSGQVVTLFDAAELHSALSVAINRGDIPSDISDVISSFHSWLLLDGEPIGFEIY